MLRTAPVAVAEQVAAARLIVLSRVALLACMAVAVAVEGSPGQPQPPRVETGRTG